MYLLIPYSIQIDMMSMDSLSIQLTSLKNSGWHTIDGAVVVQLGVFARRWVKTLCGPLMQLVLLHSGYCSRSEVGGESAVVLVIEAGRSAGSGFTTPSAEIRKV